MNNLEAVRKTLAATSAGRAVLDLVDAALTYHFVEDGDSYDALSDAIIAVRQDADAVSLKRYEVDRMIESRPTTPLGHEVCRKEDATVSSRRFHSHEDVGDWQEWRRASDHEVHSHDYVYARPVVEKVSR